MKELRFILIILNIFDLFKTVSSFTVSSPAFKPYGVLPDFYNCNSPTGGVNPPFQWVNTPVGTKSFALLMFNYQKDGNGKLVSTGDDWGLYVSDSSYCYLYFKVLVSIF